MKNKLLVIILTIALSFTFIFQDNPSHASNHVVSEPSILITFNPSGTHIHDGQLKVRLDIYFGEGSATYDQQYIDVADSPYLLNENEVRTGWIDQARWDLWWETTPKHKELNPALSIFVSVAEATTKTDIESWLASEYTADVLATLDETLSKEDSLHLISPYLRERTILAKESIQAEDEKTVVDETNARLSSLSLFRDTGDATALEPQSIDVGDGATNRSGSNGGTNRSFVALDNPANASGTIDTVELWSVSQLSNVKVGVAFGTAPDFTTRDFESIGNNPSGSKQTYSGLDIDVETGDFANQFQTGGTLEWNVSGFLGVYMFSGDAFDLASHTYGTLFSGDTMSFFGTGEEAAGPPTVVTDNATDVSFTTVTSSGNITSVGSSNVTERGFQYGIGAFTDNVSEAGNFGTGNYTLPITGLTDNTEYQYRAFAENSQGIAFGASVNFTTLEIMAPTVVTNAAQSVEETTANVTGNITATGGENPSHVYWYYDTDTGAPYADSVNTSGDFSTGEFSFGLVALTKGELYYGHASANNSGGTGNGSEVTFLTKPDPATNFGSTGNGTSWISSNWTNGAGMDFVEVRYATGSAPSDNTSGTLGFWGNDTSANVTSLSPGTIYFFRIFTHANEGGLWSTADGTTTFQDTTDSIIVPEGVTIAPGVEPGPVIPVDVPVSLVVVLASIGLPALFTYMAFWQKDMILYYVSGIIVIIMASNWIAEYPGVTVAGWFLGVYQIIKGQVMMLEAGGASGGFRQLKGMFSRGGNEE